MPRVLFPQLELLFNPPVGKDNEDSAVPQNLLERLSELSSDHWARVDCGRSVFHVQTHIGVPEPATLGLTLNVSSTQVEKHDIRLRMAAR